MIRDEIVALLGAGVIALVILALMVVARSGSVDAVLRCLGGAR